MSDRLTTARCAYLYGDDEMTWPCDRPESAHGRHYPGHPFTPSVPVMSDRLTAAGEELLDRFFNDSTVEDDIRAIEAEAAARAVDEALSGLTKYLIHSLSATGAMCGVAVGRPCDCGLAAALVAHLRGPR